MHTDTSISGHPAAGCPLGECLDDELLQHIAMEDILAKTVVYVKNENTYQISWFTPKVEVVLWDQSTLAMAFVLFNVDNHLKNMFSF